jgi:hypothetical protein
MVYPIKRFRQRFRGSKKRIAQIRFSVREKWFGVLLGLLTLLAALAGGWLGANYHD